MRSADARGAVVLELVIGADGRYLDANEPLLDTLGYTLDEIRSLHVGDLSSADPAATAELWARFTAGEITIPVDRAAVLKGKHGRTVGVLLRGVHPAVDPGTWRFRLEVAPGAPTGQMRTLQYLLEDWRAAERALDAIAPDDPARPAAEARAVHLRDLYQRESGRGIEGK